MAVPGYAQSGDVAAVCGELLDSGCPGRQEPNSRAHVPGSNLLYLLLPILPGHAHLVEDGQAQARA